MDPGVSIHKFNNNFAILCQLHFMMTFKTNISKFSSMLFQIITVKLASY